MSDGEREESQHDHDLERLVDRPPTEDTSDTDDVEDSRTRVVDVNHDRFT